MNVIICLSATLPMMTDKTLPMMTDKTLLKRYYFNMPCTYKMPKLVILLKGKQRNFES